MLVGERMTRNPFTITPNTTVTETLDFMRREKVRRLPVVDKKGTLRLCTIKVEGVPKDELVAALKPLVQEVIDAREV